MMWLCALGKCLSLSEPQFLFMEMAGRAGLRGTQDRDGVLNPFYWASLSVSLGLGFLFYKRG